MPTLHWIGKEKVINHHMDVPFKVLEHVYNFDNGNQTAPFPLERAGGVAGNKIIHGDNLEALKSLLPEYEGKIKCIYIDPPYNTGNEGWVYNDNVTDTKIKKWLGQVVGKESEDLSRHDKWLCMMYPRLVLLKKLLSDEGSIWISMDDSESHRLRIVLDEIFGENKFIACNIWQKRYSRENRQAIGDTHEFIYVYAINPDKFKTQRNKLPLGEKQLKVYKNPNNDIKGAWRATSFSAQGFRPNQMYEIVSPKTGKKFTPPEGSCWKKIESEYFKLFEDNLIYFGKDGNAMPQRVQYLKDIEGIAPWTWWPHEEVGHTDESRKEIQKIFGSQTIFDTPKPVRLLERIVHIASNKGDIILDSFAGSGTTAHAVLNMNKQDGGNRKFILIEMEDYAETITAERVKRVINGYGDKEGTGGSFDYFELGQPLFIEEGILNELVGIEKIRAYIWYSETHTNYELGIRNNELENAHNSSLTTYNSFLGKHNDTAYYFNYETDRVTTLNHAFLATMKTKAEQYVVYADNCLLTKEYITKHHLTFKKIPRDITRF